MNEIIKAMEERRSVRKFKPDMPAKADIEQIIEAGLYAANGRGRQCAIVIAVTNKELRDRIAEDNRKIGGWNEGFDPFYGAPVILIVLAEKSWPTAVHDGSLVMGNLMLAAHSLGLGSIWIHRAKEGAPARTGRSPPSRWDTPTERFPRRQSAAKTGSSGSNKHPQGESA